jgi:hypothetical protein
VTRKYIFGSRRARLEETMGWSGRHRHGSSNFKPHLSILATMIIDYVTSHRCGFKINLNFHVFIAEKVLFSLSSLPVFESCLLLPFVDSQTLTKFASPPV